MTQLSIALNAESLTHPRYPLWKPFIEAFAQNKVRFFYLPEDASGELKQALADWLKRNTPEKQILQGVEALKQSEAECLVSFNPPQDMSLRKFNKPQCWTIDSDPKNTESSLQRCFELGSSLIFTEQLVEELPNISKLDQLLAFESVFCYIPPCISSLPIEQEKGEKALFLYDSREVTKEDKLSTLIPAFQESDDVFAFDIANKDNVIDAVEKEIAKYPLTVVGFKNPQYVFWLKMLAATNRLNISIWDETRISPIRQVAFGLEPMSQKAKLRITEENTQTRLERLIAPIHDFNRDGSRYAPVIISDEVFKEGIVSCHPRSIQAEVEQRISQVAATPPVASNNISYHEWVLNSVYGDHPEFPWWHDIDSFVSLKPGAISKENPTLLRLAHTFLEAFERESFESKYRSAYHEYRDRLYQGYVKRFMLHYPCPAWLQHFARCYFRFSDWIQICDKTIAKWYQESDDNRGGYSLIAIGLIEGALANYKKASADNPLVQQAEYFIDKDFEVDRVDWRFASHRALISLVKGNPEEATYYIDKVYTIDPTIRDGYSLLGHYLNQKGETSASIDWFEKDFKLKKQSMGFQLEYMRILAKNKLLDKAMQVIESIYNENKEIKGLGLEAATAYFHPHWFDLYDATHRSVQVPYTKKCINLLELDKEYKRETLRNYRLEAYWRLYALDFDCVEVLERQLKSELGKTTGYGTNLGLILWAMNQQTLAQKVIGRDRIEGLEEVDMIHMHGVTQALLGNKDEAKKAFNRLYNEHRNYFNTTDDGKTFKWFYQILAYRAVCDQEKADRYITYAREMDPLFNEAKLLLDRAQGTLDDPSVIPSFPEPQLAPII